MAMVPVRAVPVLAWYVNVRVMGAPVPVPLDGVTLNQDELVALHGIPDCVVKVKVPLPAAAATLADPGLNVNVAPLWVSVKAAVPTVMTPVREAVELLTAKL